MNWFSLISEPSTVPSQSPSCIFTISTGERWASEPSTVLYRCHMWVPLETAGADSRLHPHLLLTGGGWIRWGEPGWKHMMDPVFGCRFSAYV